MSEQPPVSSPSFFSRKIGGIPVLYLVGGFVVVLAVIAWRMKPNSVASEEPAMSADDPFRSDANIRNEDDSPLPPIPVGTVVAPVQGTPANPDQGNAAIQTNTDWLKAGVEFLVSKKQGPAEAQRALSTYLDGTDMTMAQQAMVDQVIAEYGLPPDPGSVGATLPPPTVPKPPAPKPAPVVQAPARNQGPLPRTHIVKSTNEDSAGELAFLYYGASSAPNINLIVQANSGKAQWNVGEGVKIPARPASLTPTVHRVRTTYEDSPGEIANMYYGRTDAFAISVITKANGNRTKFLVGDLVNVPKFPSPAR